MFRLLEMEGEGGMRPGELLAKAGMTRAAMAKNINALEAAGFVEREWRRMKVSGAAFSRDLAAILEEDGSMAEVLSGWGVPFLAFVIQEGAATANEVAAGTGMSVPAAYIHARKFISRGIIRKEGERLEFNRAAWEKLYAFITSYKSHWLASHNGVPVGARVYYEGMGFVVFSFRTRAANASLTAFSLYEKYGIALMDGEKYYRSPPGRGSIKEVFLDSLRIASSPGSESIRRRLYCFLFYLKNRKLLKGVRHNDMDVMEDIVAGKAAPAGYPSGEEIRRMCEEYDIRL